MISSFKKGIAQAIGFVLILSGAVFAFQVSGTIKTWVTGETLTAADLNTTVQSLKSAVEGATQVVHIHAPRNAGTDQAFQPLLSYFYNDTFTTAIEPQIPMTRSGTIKSARLEVYKVNPGGVACTVTLRKNGVNTAIEFSIPSGSTTTLTDSDTVSFVAGDVLTWRNFCGPSGNQALAWISFEF